jgi:hypothetical protein
MSESPQSSIGVRLTDLELRMPTKRHLLEQ